MKLITRDTDYAIRVLCLIAKYRKDDRVTVEDLIEDLRMPRPFLRKIMQILSQHGVLKSFRGVGGGFLLGRPLEEIRLIDIVRIFQGEFNLNQCLFRKKLCPSRGTCALREKLESIQAYVKRELESVTVASLCKGA